MMEADVSLALFDLDNTLLNGDSDYLWGVFLGKRGIVDADWYEAENQRFYDEYKRGELDIHEFLRFSLKPLADNDPCQLTRWHAEFMQQMIEPIITEAAERLIEQHRRAGDTLLIITATNSFVTRPIARRLGVPNLIATEPAHANGRFTGQVEGTPCFQHGKVERLNKWLAQHKLDLSGSHFYSDSHNDLPLLERVENPVAVDPDERLRAVAEQRGWPIISLRD